ncbi:yhr100cp-like protein [Colletotrichum incanum]|uniref:Yhr100cp-like protein n=1 Tax=Colletotrichum incanum TaxID=1573173 RepID=A0A162Q525_COLIC|nr:yhr100cp-like protein [Colletotrichum incanum]
MGGKVWSAEEERVFWRVIVPQSQKRIGTGPAQTKNWEDLAPLMQSIMGIDAKRTYTHLGLFEHFFQNVEKTRVSPNAGVFVREYRQAIKRVNKAKEEERAKKAELNHKNDDVTLMMNEGQDTDSQGGNEQSYHTSETPEVEDQSQDYFENEYNVAKDNKENQPRGRLSAERPRSRVPTFSPYGLAPMANMGLDDDLHGMSAEAPLSAELSILGDTWQSNGRAHAANMGSYNEVAGIQIQLSAEYSPYKGALSRVPKRRNNHRSHPYKGARPQQRGLSSTKGHARIHSQLPQGNTTYYAAPNNHHSAQHYYTPIELGYQAPLREYHDYGYHDEHFQPYPEYHNHPQCDQSHLMGLYDQAPGHLHNSHSHAPRHPMSRGFCDSENWQSPDRNSASMAANYESPEHFGSLWASYNGHSCGSIRGNYVRSESRSSAGRDYDLFIPEHVQRSPSSASGSQQLAP